MKKRTNDDMRAIIIKNIFTYFNAIFLGITILLLLAGSYRSLTFLPVVVANILIGIVQQIKVKKILDKLTLLSQAKYTVLRDGSKTEATVKALSPGDIIFLEGGQQIPADVEVIEGKIAVNEALLTGEADEIEKRPGSSLLSGSFVVSGACRGRLTAVGEESYIAQLTARAKEMKESPSEMVGDIDWIIKIAGIVILPVGALLFLQSMVMNGQTFQASVVSVAAGTLATDAEFKRAIDNYTVFGRVKPEQKKQVVEALKAKGLRVAMTGDGVNDILAMKEADCSIAMGAGSDATMQAAQVVLLDSDFSHMKEIISEGRRDINNITRSATLFLYKNIFSMLLAVFAILNAFAYPLQPSQVSLVSMFNIGIPAFALALEPNDRKQHGRFIKVTLMKSLPAALTSFFSIAALVVFGKVFAISESDIGIASTFLLSMVGFMILIKICTPMTFYRRLVLAGCIMGFVVCAYLFANMFAIRYVSYQCVMLAAVFAIAQESMMRNFTLLFERRQGENTEGRA